MCLDHLHIVPYLDVAVQVHIAVGCLAARGVPVPVNAAVQERWRRAALDQAVNDQAKRETQMGAMHKAVLESVQAVASSEQLMCSVKVCCRSVCSIHVISCM